MSKIVNAIEEFAKEEFQPGVSAGAAARQLCRTLGACGYAPTLKRMLEELLASANVASHERYLILRDFEAVDAPAAHSAKKASFKRGQDRSAAAH